MMNIPNTLKKLWLGLILIIFPIIAEAQTQLIVELLDLSKTEYRIPEDGGFHFENGFLIIDDEGENNHSISIFTIRKISLQALETTGQEEIEALSLSVYPNPATDYIILETEMNEEQQFSVYSSAGILCLQSVCRTGEPLDVSSLPAGLYVLCVNGQSLKFCKL